MAKFVSGCVSGGPASGCLCILYVVGLALAGCATTQADTVADINWQVNHDHPYQHYAKRDCRELKPGELGNCAAIAYTKKAELDRRGVKSP